VFREVRRDISLSFDFATTDSLRTALSLGCRALHFSGHGHPSCLIFEDGQSGLQNISVDALKNLVTAGGLTLDFVFVSACHSRNTGEAFAEAGVPHVVCCKIDAKVNICYHMKYINATPLTILYVDP
jgi:Peptidase family C25